MSNAQTQMRTAPRANCFLCEVPGKSLYHDLPSALFATPGRWAYSRCDKCGLVWMNPCPIEEDVHQAYETYFTHGGDEKESFSLRDFLYSAYNLANLPGWMISGIGGEKARRAQMFLQGFKPGTLLDVGCGNGRFLYEMQQRGWTVDGIDFDEAAIKTAKSKYGLTLRHGDLRKAALSTNTFDAVTMSHVIEHVYDPIGLLTEIRRILKPGGHLSITTPNIGGLGHRRFKQYWWGLDAPRHLNLFTASALSDLGRRAGFKAVDTTSTSASADIFIGGSLTAEENPGHQMGHQPPPNVMRTLKAAWWQYREHFALRKDKTCGEELVMICTKDPTV